MRKPSIFMFVFFFCFCLAFQSAFGMKNHELIATQSLKKSQNTTQTKESPEEARNYDLTYHHLSLSASTNSTFWGILDQTAKQTNTPQLIVLNIDFHDCGFNTSNLANLNKTKIHPNWPIDSIQSILNILADT